MESNPQRMSVDEFMALEEDGSDGRSDGRSDERSDVRYELICGEVAELPSTTFAHGLLVGNVFDHARKAADRNKCIVLTSGCAVVVRSLESVFVPDVYGVCEPVDDHQCRAVSPCFVIEVLSPSTAKNDRHLKRIGYLMVPSIDEYVIVDQSRMHVEVFHRVRGPWIPEILDKPDDVLAISCIDLQVPLEAIYQRVNLPKSEVA